MTKINCPILQGVTDVPLRKRLAAFKRLREPRKGRPIKSNWRPEYGVFRRKIGVEDARRKIDDSEQIFTSRSCSDDARER